MARGRKPTPTHLKLVTGNPGRRPLNKDEPQPVAGRPKCPAHCSKNARKLWDYVCDLLHDMGLLATSDAVALEMLCEAYSDFLAASDTLKEFGDDFYETTNESGSTMYRVHPALAKKQDADRRIRGWLAEFGLTPSSRTRVKAGTDGKEEDPIEKYFGRKA